MRRTFIKYLRWLLVLPGSIVIGILATFPLHWLLYLFFSPTGEESELGSAGFFIKLFSGGAKMETIEYVLYPAVIAATFIIAGYKIAPNYKFRTAILLFIIYFIVWSIVSFIALSKGDNSNGYAFQGRTILALLGAAAGLMGTKMLSKKVKDEEVI